MHPTSLVALLVPVSFVVAQQTQTIFDAPVVVVDAFSRIDELADLDLDGDLDGFGLYFEQAFSSPSPMFIQAKLHRNDGAGRFTSSILYQWSTPSGGQPTTYRSAVGDVDGDGHADVVTLRGTEIWVVDSRPNQPNVRTLLPVVGGTGFPLATAAQLCDLNDDGRAELITADTFFGVRVFTLNATSFQQRAIAVPTVPAAELVVFDANGDGVMEAAAIDGGALRWFAIEQTGGIAPFATSILPVTVSNYGSPGRPAVGDVDNDLDLDIIVFGPAGQYCKVEQTAPGQFVVHPAVVGGPANYLHDVDGDGDLDGTCCGGGGVPQIPDPNNSLGNFQVAENLGGGVFAPAWRMPTIGTFHLAGCADVDGDGRRDLVGGRCVYFGRGRNDPVAGVLEVATATSPADIDRDGDPDLLDTSGNQWTNRGNGTFGAAPITLPAPSTGGTWSVRPGPIDFDQDGDVDVLANQVLFGTPVATHLLRNCGGGLFVDAGALTANGTAIANQDPLLAGDVDGDGDLDVLVTNANNTAQAWLQSGGMLVPGPAWSNSRFVGVGEFTGDACADVLLATYPYPPSTYWMQLSLQVFGSSGTPVGQLIAGLSSLDAPGIVDHEGDGDLDLVVFEWSSLAAPYVLRVLINNGLGVFSPGPVLAPARLGPRARIAVADVDGNGLYDLVAGPAGYPDVLLNSNAGVWVARQLAPQQFTSVLHSSQFGWPRDADGDGDVDLVGRAVLRNIRFDGAAAGEREQFGEALPGTGGGKPVLGATGPFRAGGALMTRLTGGCGQCVAMFVASFFQAPQPIALVPGFLFYLDSPLILGAIVLDGGKLAAGEGSASFSLPILPFVAGWDFYQQAIVADPAGVAPGVTHSQALRVRIGW